MTVSRLWKKYVKARKREYDLILMDIMMPVMDGLEAAREIRKLPRNDCKTLPIVAMSANAFDEDVKKSLASGMDAHLSKPINMEQLEKTLARFVKGPRHLMFGGNEMSFLIDIQGTGKCIIDCDT